MNITDLRRRIVSPEARAIYEKHFGFLHEETVKAAATPSSNGTLLTSSATPDSTTVRPCKEEIYGHEEKPAEGLPSAHSAADRNSLVSQVRSQFQGKEGIEATVEVPRVSAEAHSGKEEKSPRLPPRILSTRIPPTRAGLPDVEIPRKDLPLSPYTRCTLHDVVTYFRSAGVVDEENIAVGLMLALANRSSVGVEGYSGSGKTFITNIALKPVMDQIYMIGLASKMAMFYDQGNIAGKALMYLPELQKLLEDEKDPRYEAIKDLTEGRDARRLVTQRNCKGTTEFVIPKGMPVWYTLAVESKYKKSEELSRRFIRFITDSTPEHLQHIHESKAHSRISLGDTTSVKSTLERRIREHLLNVWQLGDVKVIDPFAEYVTSLVPKTQKSVSYIDHYYSLLDGCAKFNAHNRVSVEVGDQRYLLINLEDHYTVFRVYFSDFIRALRDFTVRKEASGDKLDEEERSEIDYFQKVGTPDWTECYVRGEAILINDPGLSPLREADSCMLDMWKEANNRNGSITGQDYITGKEVVLANLAEMQVICQTGQLNATDALSSNALKPGTDYAKDHTAKVT